MFRRTVRKLRYFLEFVVMRVIATSLPAIWKPSHIAIFFWFRVVSVDDSLAARTTKLP